MNRTSLYALLLGAIVIWVIGWSSLAAFFWYRDASTPAEVANVAAFQIRFGTLEKDGDGSYVIAQETTVIPMRFGDSSYGFQVIPPDDTPYTLQFICHFPTAPKIISGDVFDTNKPSTVMHSQKFNLQGGCVEDLGFDPGDPMDDQSMDILINGQLVKTIKFTVVAGK